MILGGSWVVISGVISPLIWVITIVTLLITPLITTHEPPSRNPFKGTLLSVGFRVGLNPALPIMRNITHTSHGLGSLRQCRVYISSTVIQNLRPFDSRP